MPVLVAIAYPGDPGRALGAAREIATLPFADSVELDDAVAVIVDSRGHAHLRQSSDLTSEGALDGALVGLVAGVVLTLPFPFLAPVAFAGAAVGGSAIGALTGGLIGHYSDIGIDDTFVRDVSAKLPPESSALFVLVEDDVAEKVLGGLAECGGELLTSDLAEADAEKLRSALKAARKVQEG